MFDVTFAGYVARRTLFAVLAVYLVLTATFAVVALTPNAHLGGELSAAAYYERASAEEREELRETYLEERNLDRPLAERYVGWLVDVTTLDLGYSYGYERPVTDVLGPAIQRTALYVVPAFLFALLLGTGFGVVSGEVGGIPDAVVRVASYAAVGLPAFVVAFLVPKVPGLGDLEWLQPMTWDVTTPFVVEGQVFNPNAGLWPTGEPLRFLVPAAVFALVLVGWQLRYVRTAYLERNAEESVKLHRAKGASRLRVARHVLRNAAIPIVSASLSELLAVSFLTIFVIETVFGIQGVAAVNMAAVRVRDMPLILGSSLALAVAGVLASYVQDLLYGYLDPRVRVD